MVTICFYTAGLNWIWITKDKRERLWLSMAVTEHRHGFFSQDFYSVHFVIFTNVTTFKIITTYARHLQHYNCTTVLHGCIICNICAYHHASEHSNMIVLYLSFHIKSIEVVSADLCFWDVTLKNLSTPVYICVYRLFWWYEACGITWKFFFLSVSGDQGQASWSILTLNEGWMEDC